MNSHYPIIIVGAGMSGLTAAASLAQKKHRVLLLEQSSGVGGLVNSFWRDGFLFDGGIRAVENAGMVKPMLEELGIDLPLLPSRVSLGVAQNIITADSEESLGAYEQMLMELYPDSTEDVKRVIRVIARFDMYMKVLFGNDSPFYKDIKRDIRYYLTTFPLWLLRFLITGAAITRMQIPMETFLNRLIRNDSLRDIISQHFFRKTPAFFAMSYFSLYPDYYYPAGGVGSLPNAIAEKFTEFGGELRTETQVTAVDAQAHTLTDSSGKVYTYDKLIWCADMKSMYRSLSSEGLPPQVKADIGQERDRVRAGRGAESVFTLFLGVDLSPEYFRQRSQGHFFYTPVKDGLGQLHREDLKSILDRWESVSHEEVYTWLEAFCRLNTYEISIPVLNDSSAAPEGNTGVIASFLFDYELVRRIEEDGWYEEFTQRITELMVLALSESVYEGLDDHILFSFTSGPRSIERVTGSSEGAIVGWSFEQDIPIKAGMLNMKKAVISPIPDIYRAGQWTVSPAGLPTCFMTAKMASDLIDRELRS